MDGSNKLGIKTEIGGGIVRVLMESKGLILSRKLPFLCVYNK